MAAHAGVTYHTRAAAPLRAGMPSPAARRRAIVAAASADADAPAPPPRMLPTLLDVPVSNYCARVRYALYAKGLIDKGLVALDSPASLGGLQSPAYKALNPHSKMPLFLLPPGGGLLLPTGSPASAGALYEADAILRYVLARWHDVGPTFDPPSPEAAALSDLAIRVMDTYIFPHQGCMYKGGMDAGARAAGLAAIASELDVLEALVSGGPRVVGDAWTPADASLFPTLVFCERILPAHFGWEGFWEKRPRLAAHYRHMREADPAGRRVVEEMLGGLAGWADADGGRGRWAALGIADQVRADPGAFRH